MHAREVAGPGELPREADRGVEPALELLAPSGAREDLRVSERAQRPLVVGLIALRDPGGNQGGAGARLIGQRAHDRHQQGGFQEREAPVTEVIGERAERLRTQGYLVGQPPTRRSSTDIGSPPASATAAGLSRPRTCRRSTHPQPAARPRPGAPRAWAPISGTPVGEDLVPGPPRLPAAVAARSWCPSAGRAGRAGPLR